MFQSRTPSSGGAFYAVDHLRGRDIHRLAFLRDQRLHLGSSPAMRVYVCMRLLKRLDSFGVGSAVIQNEKNFLEKVLCTHREGTRRWLE